MSRLQFPYQPMPGPDGKPVPVRRHHPTNPQRQRPPRFGRPALVINASSDESQVDIELLTIETEPSPG